MFRNYLKTACRNLLNNKIYSFINIAGLSLGLACAMLIMLYVNDEVSYDRFHKNVNQIYRIDKQSKKNNGDFHYNSYTGYFPGPRFAARIPEIKSFVRFQPGVTDIKNGNDVQSQDISYVDPNFFSVFTFPLVNGSAATALAEPNSIVLTQDMAKKYFGNTDALGKTMLLKGANTFEPFVVTGIAKNCPQNSSIKFNVLLPLKVSVEDENNNGNWFNSFLSTFIVLVPNANIKSVQNKMDKVFQADASVSINEMRSKYGISDVGISYALEPLTEIHLGKEVEVRDEVLSDKSSATYSYILSGIALFILLIACINFVNLTIARSVKRAREIGVRKVIGSTRKQLMIQFLSESFLLCLVAFSFAMLIVILVLPLFNQLSDKALSFSYLLSAKLIIGYITVFISTSLLAGFYPAAVLSNYNAVQTLYNRFTMAGKNHLQKSLVIFQFTLASFLIMGTIAIFLQFNYLITQSLGYDDSNLITVKKYQLTRKEAALFKQALLNNPAIVDVAPKSAGYNNNTAQITGGKQINVVIETIDASYLPLLKVPVVSGRNFSPDLPSDQTQTVLVNETFVKQAGWKQPLNQQVTNFANNKTYTVAGVVKDYHYKPLTEQIGPQIFTMNPDNNYGLLYIKIRPNTEVSSLQYIAETFKNFFPQNPFAYNFKQEQNERSYAAEAKWKQIILFSAILTIFISCIGLFGLSVLSAEKRTKEIGIRKVLGASVISIVSILSADFLKLIFIALTLSIPLAWIATSKWLENYPYRITLNWWLFAFSGLLVILVALITISFQSIKAAISNPAKSLRTE
jgi:putative ABC transport system permease protein